MAVRAHPRVELELIGGGKDSGSVHQLVDLRAQKVGHANRARLARPLRFNEARPHGDSLNVGSVPRA